MNIWIHFSDYFHTRNTCTSWCDSLTFFKAAGVLAKGFFDIVSNAGMGTIICEQKYYKNNLFIHSFHVLLKSLKSTNIFTYYKSANFVENKHKISKTNENLEVNQQISVDTEIYYIFATI